MYRNCFDFTDYKEFLRNWVSAQPNGGRGLYRRFAALLKIHSTMVSHIVGGKQQLTEDQALVLAEFMGLSDSETDYFGDLVRLGRATTPKLRARIKRRLEHLRGSGRDVQSRLPEHYQMTEEDSARFYSSWHYSALRLLSDIPEFQTRARLLEALPIPRETANEAITFLIERGLCREERGLIAMGPSRSHLTAHSPYIWNLHKNWRLKAFERHTRLEPREFLYTAPMSIAAQDVERIRERLLQLVVEVTQTAARSQAEQLVCLNIDWFKVT